MLQVIVTRPKLILYTLFLKKFVNNMNSVKVNVIIDPLNLEN